MNASLLITVVSVLVAIVALAIAWRVSREEKRRSDARIVALRAELGRDEEPSLADIDPWEADEDRTPAPATTDLSIATAPVAAEHLAGVAASDGMFGAVDRPAARRVHPAMLAVAGAIVLALIGTVATGGREKPLQAPSPAAQAAAPTLELLSMHHERDEKAWRITGLVRNPAQNLEVSNITAVAFLFGRDGTFLGSGRAPLDFVRLAPGDEAGFAIAVEVTGPVSRYRLSFRGADGAIVRHVDRRAPAGTTGD